MELAASKSDPAAKCVHEMIAFELERCLQGLPSHTLNQLRRREPSPWLINDAGF